MKQLFVVAVIGSVLVAGGAFVAGDLSVALVTSSRSADPGGPVGQAAAGRRVTLQVDNMYCASCPYIVRQSLAAVPGVTDVSVSFRNKTAMVTFDDTRTNVAALTDATSAMGYPSEAMSQ